MKKYMLNAYLHTIPAKPNVNSILKQQDTSLNVYVTKKGLLLITTIPFFNYFFASVSALIMGTINNPQIKLLIP